MKILKSLIIVGLLTGLCLSEPVARVDKLYLEGNLFHKEDSNAEWYRSHLEQDAEIGYHFRTKPDSMASIRFFLGGKASLGKGCEIEIYSETEGKVVSQGIHLKKGTFWAKFDKQKEAPIKIKTAGGVMGIRGTEFVVQVRDDGSTKLSLIEGSVEVDPDEGGDYAATPGDEVVYSPDEEIKYQSYSQEELDQRLRTDLGEAYYELRNALSEVRQSLRESQIVLRQARIQVKTSLVSARMASIEGRDALRNAEAEAGLSPDAFNDAKATLDRLDQLLKHEEGNGPPEAGPTTDDILADAQALLKSQSDELEDDPTVASIPPDEPEISSSGIPKNIPVAKSHPTVEWESLDADKYAVLFLDPKDEKIVHWVAETEQLSYTHPDDAEPLRSGVYRMRVIPLEESGDIKEAAEAVEYFFRVETVSQNPQSKSTFAAK